jgi:MFS family permease
MKNGSGQSNFKNIFRTLSSRNYRLFFGGQSISLIGTWIQQLAMGWLVYDMTGSVFILGLVGFVSRIPTLVLAPYAGVIADRFNKYRLLLLTQILAMVQSTILTVLLFAHVIEVWHLVALGLMLGIINSFDMPIRQSFIVEMIEKKEDLSNAIALNSAMVNGARLIGPTIAGILVAAVGEGWCFLLNSISFIAVIGSILMMKIIFVQPEKKDTTSSRELIDGFKYAFGFMPIKYILLLLALVSLMGMPYQVLMPVFAKDILKGGPNALGFLMAAVGVGALIGTLFLASKKSVLGYGRNIAISAAVFGGALIIFSLSNVFWLSMLILPVVGIGMMIQITSSNTLLQTLTDDDKRGRVMSLYSMAFMGMVPLGSLLTGFMADHIGVPLTVLFGGVCCIIGAIIFYIKLPVLRKLVRPIYIEKNIITLGVN